MQDSTSRHAFFIAFGIWASIGTLDVVTHTDGEVVPASQLQRVQHLEGGMGDRSWWQRARASSRAKCWWS